MTPAQSPALLEISFFVRAPKPLDFCVRDGGGGSGDDIAHVCKHTKVGGRVYFYLPICYIQILL